MAPQMSVWHAVHSQLTREQDSGTHSEMRIPFLSGGRPLETEIEGSIARSRSESLDAYLKDLPPPIATDVSRCVSRRLDERAATFESLTDDAREALVKQACAEARIEHWEALSAEKHLIASKPGDVWGEDHS